MSKMDGQDEQWVTTVAMCFHKALQIIIYLSPTVNKLLYRLEKWIGATLKEFQANNEESRDIMQDECGEVATMLLNSLEGICETLIARGIVRGATQILQTITKLIQVN